MLNRAWMQLLEHCRRKQSSSVNFPDEYFTKMTTGQTFISRFQNETLQTTFDLLLFHPSILFHLSAAGSEGQKPKQSNTDLPHHSQLLQFIWADTVSFPVDQSRDIISLACPGLTLDQDPAGPSRTRPEHLVQEAPRKHPRPGSFQCGGVAACIHNLIFSVTIQSLWPQLRVEQPVN